MNFLAVRWAMDRRMGNSYAKAVLIDIAGRADENGFLVSTLEEIAYGAAMKTDTVRRKIGWLKKAGFIKTYRGADCWAFRVQFDPPDISGLD